MPTAIHVDHGSYTGKFAFSSGNRSVNVRIKTPADSHPLSWYITKPRKDSNTNFSSQFHINKQTFFHQNKYCGKYGRQFLGWILDLYVPIGFS
jgi:hypothetical protein